MEEPEIKSCYSKMGVTPKELYLRQTGKCYLRVELGPDSEVDVMCTDGVDSAKTEDMLNPTMECVKCMTNNLVKVIKNGLKVDKQS